MRKLTKVVKLYLICEQIDKDKNEVDYKEIYQLLWELQKQERTLKNKSVQLCWEWENFASDYYCTHHQYPKPSDILVYKNLSGYIYARLNGNNDLSAVNVSSTIRQVCSDFQSAKFDIKHGTRSILSYKENQPLDLHDTSIKIYSDDSGGTFYAKLSLLSKEARDQHNFKDTSITFKIIVRDNSTKTIIERCLNHHYKICASKLIYDKKKKMRCLNLSHQFEQQSHEVLDENMILGVDLGVVMPLCASIYGSKARLSTDKQEIEKFRKKVEARRKGLMRQTKECGDGRIGHGRNTRCKPAFDIEDKIARFRSTKNHIYARELINFAIKNGCGTIQMENLKGITQNANRFLKNWSYYDLQTKIESKAQEVGITVVKINSQYTSQRCSSCGFIDRENRPTQAIFKCLRCGFEENADYNASQNIAIRDIEKIIENELKTK